ncbi:MAG: hypothetical protein WC654_03635 [Patescibacteria group bacterium]
MTHQPRFYRTDHEFLMAFMANVAKTSATAVTGQQQGSQGHRSGKHYAGPEHTGDKLAAKVYTNMRAVARMIATVTDPRREASEWSVLQFTSQAISLIHNGLTNAEQLKNPRTHEISHEYGCSVEEVPELWKVFLTELQERLDKKDPAELCAWVEYEVRFRIHPLADGSGRLATALTAWIMCRSGRAIPNYAYEQRSEMHEKLREGFDAFRDYYIKVCFRAPEEVAKTSGKTQRRRGRKLVRS